MNKLDDMGILPSKPIECQAFSGFGAFIPAGKHWSITLLISILYGLACVSGKANQSREALSNGGFESGASSWSFGYYPGGSSTSSGAFQGPNAYDGQWYAYLGDETTTSSSAYGYMYQYLLPRPEINTLAININFYLNVTSLDTGSSANDTLSVVLRFFDNNLNFLYDITVVQYSNKDREQDGNPKTYHLKQVAYGLTPNDEGRWVMVLFVGKTDSTKATTFRIDDVSAEVITPDPQYTVTPSAGAGGSISPSSAQTVTANGGVSFSATPNANYTVDQWYVNGNSVQSGGNSLSLSSINAAESVLVTFKAILYKVNVQVVGAGSFSINPPGGSYATGTPITITPTPVAGNQFSEWKGSQYSRSPVLSFAKGGSDESFELHFVPTIIPATMSLTTAGSTPTTLGINIPTPTSWLTLCEECADMNNPLWQLVGVMNGQNPISTFNLSKTSGGSGFVRTAYIPEITTMPFLAFPIHNGDTPWTAPVTAIMDHSMANPQISRNYDKDNNIRTAQGATYSVLPENRVLGKYFAILPPGATASTIFNYVGVSAADQAGPGFLQYDGHPAYDYG